MGVFKEEAYALEQVAKNQTRIYGDAADYGYPYEEDNPTPAIQALIDVVEQLKKLDKEYPDEAKFVRNRTTWDDGVSVDVIIFWEQDGNTFYGTKYSISFNRTPSHPSLIDKSSDAFISVDINSYEEPVKS